MSSSSDTTGADVSRENTDVVYDDDAGYHTPTGPEHRIPPILECPPAPRQRRSTAAVADSRWRIRRFPRRGIYMVYRVYRYRPRIPRPAAVPSTDPLFRRSSPELQTEMDAESDPESREASPEIQLPAVSVDDADCHTPEHRIPETLVCPPAPRRAGSRRRKSSDRESSEIASPEENEWVPWELEKKRRRLSSP